MKSPFFCFVADVIVSCLKTYMRNNSARFNDDYCWIITKGFFCRIFVMMLATGKILKISSAIMGYWISRRNVVVTVQKSMAEALNERGA